jgi:hypothetical protein
LNLPDGSPVRGRLHVRHAGADRLDRALVAGALRERGALAVAPSPAASHEGSAPSGLHSSHRIVPPTSRTALAAIASKSTDLRQPSQYVNMGGRGITSGIEIGDDVGLPHETHVAFSSGCGVPHCVQ